MTAISWPIDNNFPQDLLIGSTLAPNDNKVRNETEAGPDRIRLRDTTVRATIQGSIMLTDAHVAQLRTFWEQTIAFGARPFVWHDPRTQLAKTYNLLALGPITSLGNGWNTCALTLEEVPQ